MSFVLYCMLAMRKAYNIEFAMAFVYRIKYSRLLSPVFIQNFFDDQCEDGGDYDEL